MERIASEKRKERRRRISDLPEPLLLHILSFLPLKEAVATSLLSKRWRTLWRSLPKLEFDDRSFDSLKFFIQFVDAALHLAHLNSVQMFILDCRHSRLPPDKANIWINALVSHKLTHLELNSLLLVTLPSSIFICNTLRVLKLTMVKVSDLSGVNLPSLEVLRLRVAVVSNFELVRRLLSNCVRLQELELICIVRLVGHRRHSIVSHEHLWHNIARFEHLLSADVPVPANIRLMEAISNVQYLSLRAEDVAYRFDDIPTFPNVIHLQMNKSTNIDWTTVCMLRAFPKLQSLVIFQDDCDSDLMEFSTPDVPSCVSSQLKEFALFEFRGSKLELEIVKYIMEHATVLRTVIVGSRSTYESESESESESETKEKDFEMLKELSSYPRCSANCRLIYDVFRERAEETPPSTLRTLSPGAFAAKIQIRLRHCDRSSAWQSDFIVDSRYDRLSLPL
ncbi:F-box/FBD/LRR-repeat protein At4g26340-like [Neltuma alba]|uniref:F-box/FBD/LRR-repeat protein At4g26340-like n=1 Tax=Neltuma alba TaxID=207710 RepID=UPI0010A3A8C5|nr:F-box/FBD/LRR-repeat protein At4g26340-like [Prosopis alba]